MLSGEIALKNNNNYYYLRFDLLMHRSCVLSMTLSTRLQLTQQTNDYQMGAYSWVMFVHGYEIFVENST